MIHAGENMAHVQIANSLPSLEGRTGPKAIQYNYLHIKVTLNRHGTRVVAAQYWAGSKIFVSCGDREL